MNQNGYKHLLRHAVIERGRYSLTKGTHGSWSAHVPTRSGPAVSNWIMTNALILPTGAEQNLLGFAQMEVLRRLKETTDDKS